MKSSKKLKKLLLLGLGNLVAGMIFGAGCIIAERIDSAWFQAEDVPDRGKVATVGNNRAGK